jgi:pimeloyl-ACP methyl ester carboxylesterase
MAKPALETPPPELRSKRQAMLVIHGIGEQDPYETLDSFARGVFTHFTHTRAMNAKLCPVEIAHQDWTQVGVRIGFFPPGTSPPPCPEKDGPAVAAQNPVGPPAEYVDLFEFYWAPETEDKLSAVETLKWVLKTDFTPLRYFADNMQEMMEARSMSWIGALGNSLKSYARELARVLLIYVPLAAGVCLFLPWISSPQRSWGNAAKTLGPHLLAYMTVKHSGILLLYFLCALMAWFGLQELMEWKQHPGNAIDKMSDRLWLICDVLTALLFLGLALWIDRRPDFHVAWHVLSRVFGNGHWRPLAGAAIATMASYAMTAYVADVAVYTDMDAKSKSYQTRNAILAGSTAALKMLLTSKDYDRVILAGHSLGSVIAYDTINDLLAERNAEPGPAWDTPTPYLSLAELQKLKGLVTFGSPLDKIFYFFREHVKRDQAIRAQILAMLHGFRRAGAGRDYNPFRFNYAFKQLDSGPDPLVWLNAWARMDPVSAKLKFYYPDNQQKFSYAVPVLAHLSYWGDPNFYEYFCGRLL